MSRYEIERAPLVPEITWLDRLLPRLYFRKLDRHEVEMAEWRRRCADRAVREFDEMVASLEMFRGR